MGKVNKVLALILCGTSDANVEFSRFGRYG